MNNCSNIMQNVSDNVFSYCMNICNHTIDELCLCRCVYYNNKFNHNHNGDDGDDDDDRNYSSYYINNLLYIIISLFLFCYLLKCFISCCRITPINNNNINDNKTISIDIEHQSQLLNLSNRSTNNTIYDTLPQYSAINNV